jgi:hypothetical protein
MKHLILTFLILGVMITPHKVEKKHTYRTIFDYDPNKQELIELCCPRKPDPLSPMQHLPHPQTF